VTARIDPIAAAWGGLAGSIGLMVGSGRDWPARLLITAVAFGIGGFLSGVRAMARRLAHAVAAWVAAYAIHATFIVLATAIDIGGGRDAPALAPGGASAWAIAAGWALLWALVGAMLVNRWLAPAGRRRRR
jgi:hypothetical protein